MAPDGLTAAAATTDSDGNVASLNSGADREALERHRIIITPL